MKANSRAGRRLTLLSALAVLVLAGPAVADHPKYRFTAAGKAAARAAVIQKADFKTPGWKGGPTKPDLSDDDSFCPGFNPKESDLVEIGEASSKWNHTSGDTVTSDASVFRTPATMKLDWKRSVRPRLFTCLRRALAKSLAPKGRLVSAKLVGFPHIGSYVRSYRAVIAFKGVSRRAVTDFVLVGEGRIELMMTVTASSEELSAMQPFELYYFARIFSRVDG